MSDGRTIWTFDGIDFRRLLTSDEWQPRFSITGLYTKDIVLGATTAADSYVDTGAWQFEPLEMRAVFDTDADRDNMILKLLSSGALTNDTGLAVTAMLVKAWRVNIGVAGIYALDLTFERR